MKRCDKPRLIGATGWWCSRDPGHPGPCAARRTLWGWLRLVVTGGRY